MRDPSEATAPELAPDDDAGMLRMRFELEHDLKLPRLDQYLSARVPSLSRTQVQRLIDDGLATINGGRARRSHRLRAGDVVEIELPQQPSEAVPEQDIPLRVLHEDDELIVLDKQADIIVHPARSELSGTLINALAFHFSHRSRVGGGLSTVGAELARPGVVHRLDRDTTGCIVFAKQEHAHWKLGHQFEHRRVDKRYVALVHGRVEPDVQVIELPIGPHPSREKGYREKHVVRHDDGGRQSVTICRVLARYNDASRVIGDQHFTLVELELRTGRTHQIRVHLSHLGWPIVGDDMYGGRDLELTHDGTTARAGRQMLHAALLAFDHPSTQQRMRFVSSLPQDMALMVAALRSVGREQVVQPAGAWLDARSLLEPGRNG